MCIHAPAWDNWIEKRKAQCGWTTAKWNSTYHTEKCKMVEWKKTLSHTNFLVHNFMWHCTKMLLGYMFKVRCELLTSSGTLCVCVCALWFHTKLKWDRDETWDSTYVKLQLFHVRLYHTMNVLQLQLRQRSVRNSLKSAYHNCNRINDAFQLTIQVLFLQYFVIMKNNSVLVNCTAGRVGDRERLVTGTIVWNWIEFRKEKN